MVLLRTGPASLLLAPLVITRRQIPCAHQESALDHPLGVVEFGIPWYCMATAERHISSSLTSLLICCVPLFAVLVQKIRRTEERISRRRYLGLGVGAIGVALLVGLDLRGGSITWIALMMVVCLGYCFGPMILATKLAHVPGVVVVAGATAFVAICWIPWSWPTGRPTFRARRGAAWPCSRSCAPLRRLGLLRTRERSWFVAIGGRHLLQYRSRRRARRRRAPRDAHLGHYLRLSPRPGGVHLRHQSIEGARVVRTTGRTQRRLGRDRRPPARVNPAHGRC